MKNYIFFWLFHYTVFAMKTVYLLFQLKYTQYLSFEPQKTDQIFFSFLYKHAILILSQEFSVSLIGESLKY